MAADRITRIEIEGLRSIEKLSLDLDGLCVLIGEADSGKGSVVEAFAILQSVPQSAPPRTLHVGSQRWRASQPLTPHHGHESMGWRRS